MSSNFESMSANSHSRIYELRTFPETRALRVSPSAVVIKIPPNCSWPRSVTRARRIPSGAYPYRRSCKRKTNGKEKAAPHLSSPHTPTKQRRAALIGAGTATTIDAASICSSSGPEFEICRNLAFQRAQCGRFWVSNEPERRQSITGGRGTRAPRGIWNRILDDAVHMMWNLR